MWTLLHKLKEAFFHVDWTPADRVAVMASNLFAIIVATGLSMYVADLGLQQLVNALIRVLKFIV